MSGGQPPFLTLRLMRDLYLVNLSGREEGARPPLFLALPSSPCCRLSGLTSKLSEEMLTLLNISNIALIDELRAELERGLSLLTGETGSGKSIIVDALGVLIGGRFASEMMKNHERNAFIEGLF